MGLARVVRSMEILGHALVDMREAPDAQVVLEIAAVRAVRPDLDSGAEALSERVSVLERSLSGAAAFPRPGAPAPRPSSPELDATGSASPTTTAPEGPVAPRPPEEVARRPSIGAVRRSKGAADATPPAKVTAPEATAAAPEPPPDPPAAAPNALEAGGAKPGAAEPGRLLDRDSLTEAWGDGILQSLPARAKARYASGRFVSVDDQGVHFALPNSAHRDQCAEQQVVVEAALTAHFGTKIALVLDIDEATAPPPPRSGSSPGPSGGSPGTAPPDSAPPGGDAEDGDPHELMEDASTDQASDAEARLFQAFPGASEVVG